MTELTDENAGTSRRTLLVAAVFTSVGLAAGCASRSGSDAGGDPGRGSASEGAAGASGSAGSQEAPAPQAAIQVTIDGTSYSARLNGTQAAESLKPLLPLTLSFRDFSAGFEEKIADLNQPLAYDQMPAGDDPAPGTSPTGLPANGSSSTGGMSPVTTASTSSGPSTRAAPSRPSGH